MRDLDAGVTERIYHETSECGGERNAGDVGYRDASASRNHINKFHDI